MLLLVRRWSWGRRHDVVDVGEVVGGGSWRVILLWKILFVLLSLLSLELSPVIFVLIAIIIVKEAIILTAAVHVMILIFEAAIDVEASDALDRRKAHHDIVRGNRELACMNGFFEGSPIVRIHPHHHELNRAAEPNYHDLTVVHGRVAQVIDPHGD